MKKISIALIIFVSIVPLLGTNAPLHYGTEIDLLPYITGGYYSSAWIGQQGWRLRGVISHVFVPDFATEDGFTDKSLMAYALICDYFPLNNGEYRGLWLGAGVEYWDNHIRHEASREWGSYSNLVATAGAGYVIPVYRHLHINPWYAAHCITDEDISKPIGDAHLKVKRFAQEASLKIGITF